jgi:hypothetical protein
MFFGDVHECRKKTTPENIINNIFLLTGWEFIFIKLRLRQRTKCILSVLLKNVAQSKLNFRT